MHPRELSRRRNPPLRTHRRFRHFSLFRIALAVGLGLCPVIGWAGTNFITTNIVAGGSDWTGAIWKTNGSTATNMVAPTAGNTYRTISNGVSIGNNTLNTRLRPPISGTATFPGDSLTLQTNTELRLKAGSVGNSMN